MGEIVNYKKFKFSEHRPTGKQNCICWLVNDEKVACYYHQKKKCFFGRYGEYEKKKLHNVTEWAYAILPKRQSYEFENSLLTLNLRDGKEEFRIDYSLMSPENQERLHTGIELVQGAILHWFSKYE